MNYKTKKQQLIDSPYELSNDSDLLECFFIVESNLFALRFNAVLFTYKTWNGFLNKRSYFVKKYNLK